MSALATLGTDWTRFDTWQLVLPPNRPTESSLAGIETYLSTVDSGATVAILGSTIEFRDLLARVGRFSTIILEKWPQFKQRVDSLRLRANEEELISGDWLDTLPACRNQFDLVLSDFTSGNIPYDRRADFYIAIADALRPGGSFIDRVLEPLAHFRALSELDSRYVIRPSNLQTLNEFSSEYLFLSELVEREQVVDTRLFYSVLRDRPVDSALLRLAQLSELITPSDQIWYYGRPPKDTASPEDVGMTHFLTNYDREYNVYSDVAPQHFYRKS